MCVMEKRREYQIMKIKRNNCGFDDLPILTNIYDKIKTWFGEKAENLICEGNKYDNITKNGQGGMGMRKGVR